MKILLAHNHYLEPGGEDEVVAAEKAMLEAHGHQVIFYERSNKEIATCQGVEKIRRAAFEPLWSKRTYADVQRLIRAARPDVAHVHNTFLTVSPSVYQACHDERVPVVQTLHNYRFLCPTGVFYRQGRVCRDCLKKGMRAAVKNRCWKNSFALSWILVRVIREFYRRKILDKAVQRFIVLSEFSKEQYVSNGLFRDKIRVKPNFLGQDPGGSAGTENYALYVGGLHAYKGIETMLQAWEQARGDIPLKIIGDGPLAPRVKSAAGKNGVDYMGRRPLPEVIQHMKAARFLIVPSECYENFPRVVIEAFACGVPVIASGHGALKELVEDGQAGLLFTPGDPGDLAKKIEVLARFPQRRDAMASFARRLFLERYTMERNYEQLLAIYHEAMEASRL